MLNLVVLRSRDLTASKRFYEALGLVFQEERHGVGPLHWSCSIGGVVLELYPTSKREPAIGRLGFKVDDIEEVLSRLLLAGGRIDKKSANRAVLVDPDGTQVELSQTERFPDGSNS